MGYICCISVIFCEAVAIYGVIVAIILQTKLENVPASKIYAPESLRAGYAIFASGIIVGFANLVCGLISLASFLTFVVFLYGVSKKFCGSCNMMILIWILFLWQFMCGNHWKQLRIV